jgi:hypothetical protein
MSTVTDLPRRMRDAVTKEFQGERILWAGRPSASRSFLVSLPIWLFAIPWTAFSLGWEWMALGGWLSGKPPPSGIQLIFGIVFPLFGLPFVLVGLGMMATPFLAWRWARRTVHVIGDNRLVTMTVGRSLKVKTYQTASITRLERTERRNGSGTLKVIMGTHRDSDGDKTETTEVFYGIDEVAKVERLIGARLDHMRRAA